MCVCACVHTPMAHCPTTAVFFITSGSRLWQFFALRAHTRVCVIFTMNGGMWLLLSWTLLSQGRAHGIGEGLCVLFTREIQMQQ